MTTSAQRSVTGITPATIDAIRHVGRTVTYQDAQYIVHSVEGYDWYAFQSALGGINIDFNMPPAPWYREPHTLIIPTDSKIGDGLGREVDLSRLSLGVCLTKPGDSVWH